MRSRCVRLLGGLVLWVAALYCGPRSRSGNGRGSAGAGLYPQLAAFGFSDGDSTALVSVVARQCVLAPSFDLARRELARGGLDLDIKTVHRIARRLGVQALTARRLDLLDWRAGLVPPGAELAGKRVGVAVDGGRIRLRRVTRKQKGKGKKKKQRRRYKAQWREPKLLIVFEMDAQGRMVPGSRARIDGTFAGPDEVMELLAFHLHRLGAALAEVVCFLCDGAPWIWERLEWVRQRVGLEANRVAYVLDFYHAMHHVGLALAAMPLGEAERRRVYKKMRKRLKGGSAWRVVRELERMAERCGKSAAVAPEVAYLHKHEDNGHMEYARLKRRGLPIGSGAIESAIRRVVNLRLKGNGLMWLQENAEAMLVLRAAALTDRWEEMIQHAHAGALRQGRLEWRWRAPDLADQLNGSVPVKPPVPQAEAKQGDQTLAA